MPRQHDHGNHHAAKAKIPRSAEEVARSHEPSRWEKVKNYFVKNDDRDDKPSHENSRSVGKAKESKQVVEPKRDHDDDHDREERMAKAKHKAGDIKFALPRYNGGDPKEHIVKCAEQFLGERESGGKNRGPLPDLVNQKAGAEKGSYWCASFVSHVTKDTGVVKNTAGSLDMRSHFKDHGALKRNVQGIEPGDVAFFTREGGGHVGIVHEVSRDKSGRVTAFTSIEGNSGNQVRVVSHSAGAKNFLGAGDIETLAKNKGVNLTASLERNSHDKSHSSPARMLAGEPSRSSNSRAHS